MEKDRLFLFPLDQIDLACIDPEKNFSKLLPDTSYAKQNVNSKQFNFNARKLEKIDSDKIKALELALQHKLETDNQLYCMAEIQLNLLIDKFFPAKNWRRKRLIS